MSCGAEEEAVDDVVDKIADDHGDGECGKIRAVGSELIDP